LDAGENGLGVGFANGVLLWIEMTLVRAPTVGIEVLDAKPSDRRDWSCLNAASW
jgi:hypothetical protein